MPYAHIITILALVTIAMLVIAYTMYVMYKARTNTIDDKMVIKEGFADGDRSCTVYYLDNLDNQREACDAGLFDQHPLTLQDRLTYLQGLNSTDPAVQKEIYNIQQAQAAPRPGNMRSCKFTFPDWVERAEHPFKKGNATDAGNRGDVNEWAFCYRSAANFDPAKFQESAATTLYPNTVDSGSTYRMDFKSLSYNDVSQSFCKYNNTQLGADFPSANTPGFIRFKIDVPSKTVSGIELVVNDGNGKLITYPSERQQDLEKTVYKQLFEVVVSGNNVVLAPKNQQMRLYRLTFDGCGGIIQTEVKAPLVNPTLMNFKTLVEQMGVMSSVNANIMSNIPANLLQYVGNVQTLSNRINDLTSQKNQLDLDIVTLQQTIANTETTLTFVQGLRETVYPISYHAWHSNNYWAPRANVYSRQGMAEFKNKVKEQAGNNVTRRTVTTVGWGPTDRGERMFYEYEGYIYLNAGLHRFKLNSDDAGEMFLSAVPYRSGIAAAEMDPNVLVSTYYGMHGMNNQGSVVYDFTVAEGKQGYYKVLIQWFEWHGGDGYKIQYSYNKGSYTNINSNLFYYDVASSSVNEQNQKAQKERERETVSSELSLLSQYRRDIMSSIATKAYDVMQGFKTKSFVGKLSFGMVSNDGAYYLWPGDLGVPLRPNALALTDPQYISEAISDVAGSEYIADPFVINLQQPPEYTVMMWIKITSPSQWWRRIFIHGTGDDWRDTGGDFKYADRTPGVWITPNRTDWGNNDGKVRVHFRHRAVNCASNTPSRIYGGNFNCGLDMMDGTLPSMGEWFHFAATIKTIPQNNASQIRVYLNGNLHTQAQLSDNNKFDWNQLYGKKLYVGGWTEAGSGPMYIQKAKWYSMAKTDAEVKTEFNAGYVTGGSSPYPVPPSVPLNLTSLFRDATAEQTYYLKIGRVTYSVYVQPASAENGNQAWALIMNYNRNAGDSKPLKIRTVEDHAFPQGLSKLDIAWGQVPKDILNAINFGSVRFLATNQEGKKIHFRTRHPDVIKYMKTGQGKFPINQSNWYELLSGHNSTLPQTATHQVQDAGEYALTNHPFFIWGNKHWNIGIGQNRWEVDDFNIGGNKATIHTVWIGL